MKIVFLCHFSNKAVRERLALKSYRILNSIKKRIGGTIVKYDDFGIWVSDFIVEFEKHPESEFHIVAPHMGMKKAIQDFNINGIHYHFFKCDGGLFRDHIAPRFNIEEKTNYRTNRHLIKSIIDKINPDIILSCGAENPYYCSAVLDITNKPLYIILQTLLNDEKRIQMGIGTEYRRKVEIDIFQHAGYFCTSEEKIINAIKHYNSKAKILPTAFPTHRPVIVVPKEKKYDFVFFARIVAKFKGIEDTLKALSIVKAEYPNVILNVIGNCEPEYKEKLNDLILKLDITDNVVFSGYYESIEETYENVVKAKIVVVPGITAALNSTVREAMLMGLPTICYETSGTVDINKEKLSLFIAPLNDVSGLAEKMIFALDNKEVTEQVARNGKEYAIKVFSNEAIVNELLDNCKFIIDDYALNH